MTLRIDVSLEQRQPRRLHPFVNAIQGGGLVAWPGDSGYVLSCLPGAVKAAASMRKQRDLPAGHHLSLVCESVDALGRYGTISTSMYRLMKQLDPGLYTFLLPATREVPRGIRHPRRRTIGLRVAGSALGQALLQMLNSPLLTTSAIPPDGGESGATADSVLEHFQLDAILDGGEQAYNPTTVVDMTCSPPKLERAGSGSPQALGL